MSVTSPRPLNAELLWLKHDWQRWLLILILGTYAGLWAEGRQRCVPGGRHTEANSLWHAIRARSHTSPPPTLQHTDTRPISYTQLPSPLMHRRGEARREGYPLTRHTLTQRFHSTPTQKWHFLKTIKALCTFKYIIWKQVRRVRSKSEVLHLPLRSRNSSDGLFWIYFLPSR